MRGDVVLSSSAMQVLTTVETLKRKMEVSKQACVIRSVSTAISKVRTSISNADCASK